MRDTIFRELAHWVIWAGRLALYAADALTVSTFRPLFVCLFVCSVLHNNVASTLLVSVGWQIEIGKVLFATDIALVSLRSTSSIILQ
jgi:hypothetical protein